MKFTKTNLFKKNKEKRNETKTIEVSTERIWLRAALAIGFFLLGIGAIAYGVNYMVSEEAGWRTVDMSVAHPEVEDDLVFNYNLGASGNDPTSEYKAVSALYSEIGYKAYQLFDACTTYDGLNNLCSLSSEINSALEVDPLLYNALELMEEEGSRLLYLGPIYQEYESLCMCIGDEYAELKDPYRDPDTAAYIAEILSYASTADMIDLELLGENRVKLNVSAEYQKFAEENEITVYLDFYWLKNAFVVDAIADEMIANGYTFGNITSSDGFTRNMDSSNIVYSLNVFDRRDNLIYPAASLSYNGTSSFVVFRDYPMSEHDGLRYYSYSDGAIATPYADPSDGLYKSGMQDLLVASKKLSCAEAALKAFPVFLSDTLDTSALTALMHDDIAAVWSEGDTVFYNSDEFPVSNPFSEEGVTYKTQKFE